MKHLSAFFIVASTLAPALAAAAPQGRCISAHAGTNTTPPAAPVPINCSAGRACVVTPTRNGSTAWCSNLRGSFLSYSGVTITSGLNRTINGDRATSILNSGGALKIQASAAQDREGDRSPRAFYNSDQEGYGTQTVLQPDTQGGGILEGVGGFVNSKMTRAVPVNQFSENNKRYLGQTTVAGSATRIPYSWTKNDFITGFRIDANFDPRQVQAQLDAMVKIWKEADELYRMPRTALHRVSCVAPPTRTTQILACPGVTGPASGYLVAKTKYGVECDFVGRALTGRIEQRNNSYIKVSIDEVVGNCP